MRALLWATIMAGVMAISSHANATTVAMHYVNDTLVADATLDVEQGQAVRGTGSISGGGLIGTLPMVLLSPDFAPAPLVAVPSRDCGPGIFGCYDVGIFSCNCSFVAEDTGFDLSSPISVDSGGILFQVGGTALNYPFALYDAGDGAVGEVLVGDAAPQPYLDNQGTPGGTLKAEVVPEPPVLALFGMAVAGLAYARRHTSQLPRHP